MSNRWIQLKETEKEEMAKLKKKRMEAAISLKASITATQESLRMKQAKEKVRLQKKREEEERQIETLKAAGANSFKHMHMQKAQKDLRKKEEVFRERQKARQAEITLKLREEELKEKRDKRHVRLLRPTPVRVKRSVTLKQQEQKLFQDMQPPSLKTQEVFARLVSFEEQLIQFVLSHVQSLEEESREDVGGIVQEGRGDSECMMQPEFTGLWDSKDKDYMRVPDEDIPLKPSPLKSLMTGLNKILPSKENLPESKELKGPSFVSKPEIISFKHFDVGKTYKKKVVLTNVTHAINSCRLMGVSQHLKRFISVRFEPPGPLSTGMICELEVVFKPVFNDDLDGEVKFQSANGPFSVPVMCSKKKCEMVVDSSLIDFGTHVVGETISRVITLTNKGALGTHYTLTPLSINSFQHSSQHSSPKVQKPAESSIGDNDTPGEIQTATVSGTSADHCDGSVNVEVKKVEQGSEEAGEEESRVTEVREDLDFEVTEFSFGEASEGEIGPFASIKLPFIFMPSIPGEARLDVQISFSQPECKAIVVSLCGVTESVPVWLLNPSIDLKICMYDRLYQDTIEVENRANTALKVTFEVYKELKKHLDILPKMGFIQAKSNFRAQLKFVPRSSLPVDAKDFFDQETGVLEVPLTIKVSDQAKPVPFVVHAVVTTSDIDLDLAEVDFGYCSVFESVWTSVKLTNHSLLPQDFGFVGLPGFIDVQPYDGFGTLLPLQTLEIDLIFSAPKAGEYNFQLTCKSGINRDFLLSCHAVGVRPPLELSDSLVQFEKTAVGDFSTALLYVVSSHTSRNEFTHQVPRIGKGPVAPVSPRFFAFCTPENCEVVVTPATGRVLPGQRCLVQVTFNPSLSDELIRAEAVRLVCRREELRMQELQKAEAEALSSKPMEPELPSPKEDPKKQKKRTPTDQGSGKTSLKERSSKASLTPKAESPYCFQPPNPEDIQTGSDEYAAGKASLLCAYKDRNNHYIIPCFVSDGDVPQKKESKDLAYSLCNTLYLELHCPAIRPTLIIISNNGCKTVDFGQVAVGQKVLKKVTVQNISTEFVNLNTSLLDYYGPFCVVNAMREIKPGDTHTLLLAFLPTLSKKYRETLEVSCSEMTLEFVLYGECIDPLLTCSHEGSVMNFGYILEKQSTTQTFKLQNSSSLLVGFSVLLDSLCCTKHSNADLLPAFLSSYYKPCSTVGPQNYSGQSVFQVSPTEGSIAPGKSLDITVTFQPDHESLHFRDTLHVQLLNKKTVCTLELLGKACRNNMFVCGGEPLDVCTESLIPLDMYSVGEDEFTEEEKPPIPLLLTLRSVVDQGRVTTAVQTLDVGCVGSPQTKKNAEFVWENLSSLQQHGFAVDPVKGNVEAGHRRTITITWTPPTGHTPNKVVQVCVPLILRGDEKDVYNVTLLAFVSNHTNAD